MKAGPNKALQQNRGEVLRCGESVGCDLLKAAVRRQGSPWIAHLRGREVRMMLSEVHSLNERWNKAWLEKDAATVDRLMAEDYIYVAPNGMVLDRHAILTIIRSPTYQLDYATRTDVLVRALGHEAAVVRHGSQATGSFEGTSFTDDHRCVMICEKLAGEWRVVMEQHSFKSM